MLHDFVNLHQLQGTWIGTGVAEFPTHPTYQYREELTFSIHAPKNWIHYEQKAWIVGHDERNHEMIYWESGFICDKGPGLIELLCAQSTGRTECLRGTIESEEEDGIKLTLQSMAIHNDDRMINSRRIWHLKSKNIDYIHYMSTIKHPLFTKHLSAHLRKK